MKEAYKNFMDALGRGVEQLRREFPSRVVFGQVSSADASATHLQVWGANADNWNLTPGSSISGGGMAIAMAVQGPGVFGWPSNIFGSKTYIIWILDLDLIWISNLNYLEKFGSNTLRIRTGKTSKHTAIAFTQDQLSADCSATSGKLGSSLQGLTCEYCRRRA